MGDGTPILGGCASWALARPQQRVHAGRHVIIVARLLTGGSHDDDDEPLLEPAGRYRPPA